MFGIQPDFLLQSHAGGLCEDVEEDAGEEECACNLNILDSDVGNLPFKKREKAFEELRLRASSTSKQNQRKIIKTNLARLPPNEYNF